MFFQIESIQQNVFGTWINPLNQSNSCPNKHCDIFISPAQLLAGVLGKKCSATDVNLVNLDIGRCSLCCQLPSHTANLMNSPNTSITRGDLVLKSMANKQLRRLQSRLCNSVKNFYFSVNVQLTDNSVFLSWRHMPSMLLNNLVSGVRKGP